MQTEAVSSAVSSAAEGIGAANDATGLASVVSFDPQIFGTLWGSAGPPLTFAEPGAVALPEEFLKQLSNDPTADKAYMVPLTEVLKHVQDSEFSISDGLSSFAKLNIVDSLGGKAGSAGIIGPGYIAGLDGLNQPAGLDGLNQPAGLDGLNQPAGLDGLNQPAGLDGLNRPAGLDGLNQPAGLDGLNQPAVNTAQFDINKANTDQSAGPDRSDRPGHGRGRGRGDNESVSPGTVQMDINDAMVSFGQIGPSTSETEKGAVFESLRDCLHTLDIMQEAVSKLVDMNQSVGARRPNTLSEQGAR
jgi:hypothetical protein